ncbi:hypothetical protein [Petropleomorpha daqingensis]|uniref:DoxX-like family protein n=1 Tax=Petropleomorpha daqingensis TaxID=2026353 RepID=A0A853CC30_9ACTN|nr:hypothetical protein [Petropleomorpha daqingensis]NYJ05565.1 hypothetical protein [Petropleomorpha daqingensis]
MRTVVRAALALLALSAAVVGFWALFAPSSFYSSFPGLGYTWVSEAGPYDEHLVRDVGALYLALLVVTVLALLRPAAVRPWVAGVAWLVFGVPHLVFHAAHAGPGDAVEVTALALSVLLAVLACLPAGRARSMP